MGGFARYPWPQYISNAPFYYNKHYKRAAVITLFAGFVNCLWVARLITYHSVFLILVRWSTLDMAVGSILRTLTLPNRSR